MEIPYNTRSSLTFLPTCTKQIDAQRQRLDLGETITFTLVQENGEPLVHDGAGGTETITIDQDYLEWFVIEDRGRMRDWNNGFPARIKSVATALRNLKCGGTYEVAHKRGVVTIRKVIQS